MGRSTDSRGIESFWPDDDKDTLYIDYRGYCSHDYIRERMQEHFGKCAELEDFTIRGESIHTDCLGYDLYDPGDYTNFIIIERIKS